MTPTYSAYSRIVVVNPKFTEAESALWASIVQELERFNHESD
jgi:hypothetical protein